MDLIFFFKYLQFKDVPLSCQTINVLLVLVTLTSEQKNVFTLRSRIKFSLNYDIIEVLLRLKVT